MATTTKSRKQSHTALVKQVARKLKIAYAIVDPQTNRLKGIQPTRRLARLLKAPGHAIRRVDLRVKGLSA